MRFGPPQPGDEVLITGTVLAMLDVGSELDAMIDVGHRRAPIWLPLVAMKVITRAINERDEK